MNFINELTQWYHVFLDANAWIVPLAAFLLPIVESLLPILPLTAIVSVNLVAMAAIYGSTMGTVLTIILSTLGSFFGMFMIFLIIRKTLTVRFSQKVEASEFGRKFVNVASSGNTGMIMSLLCNPLLPSSIMNYTLAFTKIPIPRYVAMAGISRIVVILILVFLGSVFNIQEHPLNVLWLLLVYAGLFLIGVLYKKIFGTRNQPEV